MCTHIVGNVNKFGVKELLILKCNNGADLIFIK